jgi:hypothetical protein
MTEQPDFLARIVDRALERVPVVEPRELSRFEARRAQAIEPEDFGASEEGMRDPGPQRSVSAPPVPHKGLEREAPRSAALNSQHELPRMTGESAAVTNREIAQDEAQEPPPPHQRRETAHRAIEDSRPALVARAPAAFLTEDAKPAPVRPAPSEVDVSAEPAEGRRDRREPDEEAPRRRGRDLATPSPPRAEGLLPKQSVVQNVVTQAVGSSSQPQAPSLDSERVADTVVNVMIGRVDVRASAPAQKSSTSIKSGTRHQPMTLTEYLNKRGTAR